MRVLIAEDSDSVRYALRLVMEHLGHEVVGTATDGIDALEIFERTHPELVLMDVRMPRMDGLTCAAKLTELDPSVRVVVVTGARTTEEEARQAGAQGYVEKPFEIQELDELIHALA